MTVAPSEEDEKNGDRRFGPVANNIIRIALSESRVLLGEPLYSSK